jgi:hypothetical protein
MHARAHEAQAEGTKRCRAAPRRFQFTDTTSTPAVGDAIFVKLCTGYHKAVIKEIWHTSEPLMYLCVHGSTSLHAGTAQAVPADDITPACGTYGKYKRARASVDGRAKNEANAMLMRRRNFDKHLYLLLIPGWQL